MSGSVVGPAIFRGEHSRLTLKNYAEIVLAGKPQHLTHLSDRMTDAKEAHGALYLQAVEMVHDSAAGIFIEDFFHVADAQIAKTCEVIDGKILVDVIVHGVDDLLVMHGSGAVLSGLTGALGGEQRQHK